MSAADPLESIRDALPRKYRLEGLLRSGGQGSVYRGSVDGTPAALKLFRPGDEKRVQREIELLRTISSPYLVRILAADTVAVEGVALMLVAYEFHSGGDLERLLAPTAPGLSRTELVGIGRQVGSAVDALWARRIVHRDIKPANVVRASDGAFVLVDVGFARHLDRSDLTGLGFAVGTPGYMSPEQARGRRQLTVHSDAYSLGLTLYELAAKAHPFNRDQMRIMAGQRAADLAAVRPDLSLDVCTAIHQLLAPAASARPRALGPFFEHL